MRVRTAAAVAFFALAHPAWASDGACFAAALPADIRETRLDDVKLLIGWVFDAATAHHPVRPGDIIDRHSGLTGVPGFARATSLDSLKGRYRVMRSPFDMGHGYFGVELGALETDGRISSLYLIDRLFRLPDILHQPLGVATDIATNGAMLFGWQTRAVRDTEAAALAASDDAQAQHVPLLTAGQSQAGGEAQLQAAAIAAAHPKRAILTGFVSLNAAFVSASVRRLGLAPETVDGINFVKDLDPGFGPHGLLPNRTGLQVYVHPDATGGARAGDESAFAAVGHAGEHLLSTFDAVSLARALADTLAQSPCPGK